MSRWQISISIAWLAIVASIVQALGVSEVDYRNLEARTGGRLEEWTKYCTRCNLRELIGAVEKEVERGYDVNSGMLGDGKSPLHICAQLNCSRGIELLGRATKYPLNSLDSSGKTPLHYVIENNNFESVEYLVRKGATDYNTFDGKSLNEIAACTSSMEIFVTIYPLKLPRVTSADLFDIAAKCNSFSVSYMLAEELLDTMEWIPFGIDTIGHTPIDQMPIPLQKLIDARLYAQKKMFVAVFLSILISIFLFGIVIRRSLQIRSKRKES